MPVATRSSKVRKTRKSTSVRAIGTKALRPSPAKGKRNVSSATKVKSTSLNQTNPVESDYNSTAGGAPSLHELLSTNEFALSISPGFFRYYCYIGILHAMEDMKCLNPTHVSGASAGALVGGFLASGMSPLAMKNLILGIRREHMWDMPGFGGVIRGSLFQSLLEKHLPCKKIEDCPLRFGATAFNVLQMRTKLLHQGCLATAIRASCTFPFLFQPVWIDSQPHIDGGVFDDAGMMALPALPPSNLLVNIVCGTERTLSSVLPPQFKHATLLTIVIDNVPLVTPFSMAEMGPVAYSYVQ